MGSFAKEFKAFLMRGNVVDLAVAVVIGAAFGKIVESIVANLFMPIVNLLTGGFDFQGYYLPMYGEAKLGVGPVVQSLVNFVIIGFCLFLVVKAVNKISRKAEPAPPEASPSEKLLAEIRDLLKK